MASTIVPITNDLSSTKTSTIGPISVNNTPLCECVTPGYCEIAGGISSTDGSGILQYRMGNVSKVDYLPSTFLFDLRFNRMPPLRHQQEQISL